MPLPNTEALCNVGSPHTSPPKLEPSSMTHRPVGIDEPISTRPPIIRGSGVTATERHLAQLGEKSFLNLWSYPNVYRDQKGSKTGDGKELCDFLVVCAPHVLIFSEKNISWNTGDEQVAWCRWYRKAVKEAADQIAGAERWLAEHPDKVYLDSACSVPLPIPLPPLSERIVHRIVVARGSGAASREYFKGGSGSLAIEPGIVGDAHFKAGRDRSIKPFHVGTVRPASGFVHVLDDGSLDFVMEHLDTISDFTAYLAEKEDFILSGKLAYAASEEDLVAHYMLNTDSAGVHRIGPVDDPPEDAGKQLLVDGTHAQGLLRHPQYIAKRQADQPSYVWDALIKNFTSATLDGTSMVPEGVEYDIRNTERAARLMAAQNRLSRRGYGEAIVDALEIGRGEDRFFRGMMQLDRPSSTTAFFFLTVKFAAFMEKHGGYEAYRTYRRDLACIYAEALLLRNPHLKEVVGVAVEPSGDGKGSSEDLVAIFQHEWSDEQKARVEHDCQRFEVMQKGYTERHFQDQEFPDVEPIIIRQAPPSHRTSGPNRKQRRMMAAKLRRHSKKPS